MATALLFDRDRVDEVDDWTDSLPKVGRSAILWIDLEKPAEDDVRHLVDAFDLEPAPWRISSVSRWSRGSWTTVGTCT